MDNEMGNRLRRPKKCATGPSNLIVVPMGEYSSAPPAVGSVCRGPDTPSADSRQSISSIYAINVNSLAKAHAKEQLLADLQHYQISIAIVSETKLKKHHSVQFSALPGYVAHRRDRIGRGGGGVAIYVSDLLTSVTCSTSVDNRDYELLWVLVEHHQSTLLVGCLYHPPTYPYSIHDMYDYIEASLDELLLLHPNASVALAGDFNKLNVGEVTAQTGLIPLVTAPTRGGKILDMLMTSSPTSYLVKVITSAVRSDHRAILATSEEGVRHRTKTTFQKKFRRRTPGQHASLLQHLAHFESDAKEVMEPEVAWRDFYSTIIGWLDQFYPTRTISTTSKDPPFITPEIKYLLRRRNSLRRRGRDGEADALTLKIGRLIERYNTRELRRIDKAKGKKELWTAINKLTGAQGSEGIRHNITAEDLNSHFAAPSPDPQSRPPPLKQTAAPALHDINEQQIFGILDRLKPTAEGSDLIPAWFLRVLAPICSAWLARLFNISLCSSYLPMEWKNAIIHLLPKVRPPLSASDFRPISVVPILSRVLERLVVSGYLYPALRSPSVACMLRDQYAFRPTGSTTTALIDLLQKITNLLQHNEFVVMFTVDFTKAFDSVKHMPLMQKMELLQLPDHIYNWLVLYFEARGHSTRLENIISTVPAINASIVQGSVVGPPSYVIVASDLRQRHSDNSIIKYTDNTYFFVSSFIIHTVTEEFENIQTWAAKNNLKIHPNKTKEMLIFRRRTSRAKYSF